jgi:hypothetical protein
VVMYNRHWSQFTMPQTAIINIGITRLATRGRHLCTGHLIFHLQRCLSNAPFRPQKSITRNHCYIVNGKSSRCRTCMASLVVLVRKAVRDCQAFKCLFKVYILTRKYNFVPYLPTQMGLVLSESEGVARHEIHCSCTKGCQIFLGPNIPKRENIPKDHKLLQTAINFTKDP